MRTIIWIAGNWLIISIAAGLALGRMFREEDDE